MKIISLNTYAGFFSEALFDFIKLHAPTTDIFLFQEMMDAPVGTKNVHGFNSTMFRDLSVELGAFSGNFGLMQKNVTPMGPCEQPIDFGLATFVRRSIEIKSHEHFFLPSAIGKFSPGRAIISRLNFDGKSVTVCNVHGCASPPSKRDCPERIAASQEIIARMSREQGEKIIAGDFNLFPDTRSIEMFDEAGYKNLITDFGITTTRGSLVKQMHPEYALTAEGWQEFADYMFVSEWIRVKSFEVPDVPVSDHLPMIGEVEI